MNTGVIIFAINGDIKYTELAKEAADRVKQWLNLPTTLITDQTVNDPAFEQVIVIDDVGQSSTRFWADSQKKSQWFNAARSQALDLTPYDRTLLIDADYWIGNNNLLNIINGTQPFACHRHAMNIYDEQVKIQKFSERNVDMWWATVCVFDKSTIVQDIFTAWKMIQHNYQHYASLFNFTSRPFRNDYALSLALLLINGHEQPLWADLPWPLFNVTPECEIELTDSEWNIRYQRMTDGELKPWRVSVSGVDLHIMGKSNLEKICEG